MKHLQAYKYELKPNAGTILPVVSCLAGGSSMVGFVTGSVGGGIIAIFLRATVVALRTKKLG